jgi:hypothetical protein
MDAVDAIRLGQLLGRGAGEVFAAEGGTALGLRVAAALEDTIAGWRVPPMHVLPLDELRQRPAQRIVDQAPHLSGRPVVVKTSRTSQPFGPLARRGVDSSSQNGRFTVTAQSTVGDLGRRAAGVADPHLRALVLQALQPCANGMSFIVHAEEDGCAIECVYQTRTYFFVVNGSGRIVAAESSLPDRSTSAVTSRCDVAALAAIHARVRGRLGFPVNTEGFFVDGCYLALQLRPVPRDNPVDHTLTGTVARLRAGANPATRFVWGAFDTCGSIVVEQEAPIEAATPLLLVARRSGDTESGRRARQLSRLEKAGLLLPHERYSTERIADGGLWASAVYRRRVQLGLPTVLLDVEAGFHLNHKREYLPPPGPLRDAFRYLSLPEAAVRELTGRPVRAVSDGEQGVLAPADE